MSEARARTILGVDPGSLFTGFGALRINADGELHVVSCGVIQPPHKLEFNERIGIIASEFEFLLEKLQPEVTVIERVFLGKNADSAFKLGHARGITVAASIRAGCEVVEYATRAVKKGITGSGSATKEQVQIVLYSALGLAGKTRADASDALALAYHHARILDTASRRGQPGAWMAAKEIEP